MATSEEILNVSLLLLQAKFPRIGKALEFLWGQKEFPPYVNKLLNDGRNDRQGFPVDVMTAIMSLQILHDEMFPQFQLDDPDDWKSSQFGIN